MFIFIEKAKREERVNFGDLSQEQADEAIKAFMESEEIVTLVKDFEIIDEFLKTLNNLKEKGWLVSSESET